MENTNRKFYLAGTIFTIITLFSGVPGPLIIKYIAPYMDFWTQNFLRYVTAVITMLPFVLLSSEKHIYSKDLWRKTLLIAIINIFMQCCWGSAFYYINPAFVTLLSKSSVLWTIAISLMFFIDERPLIKSKAFWASFIIVIIGIAGVTFFKQDFSASGSVIGIVLTLGFAVSWAIYATAIKALLKNEDSSTSFAVVSVYSAIGLGILAFCFGKPMQCVSFSGNIWFLLILSSLTSITISHITFYASIKRVGSSIPSLVVLAQPFLVLIVSGPLFGERLLAPQWFFGLLLIAGAALAIKAQDHLNKN
jgi:drug/metabolite transporter (DMT)-like permease